VRIRSQEEAIAAYLATQSGVIPEGYSVTANCVMDLSFILEDGTCLWSVGLKPDDTEGGVTGGYRTFIGPDGKLWRFPSSPLCDRDIAVSALTHLYLEGVADLVDSESLAEQVMLITGQRDGAIFALPDAARRGELRPTAEDH
jgi:hypothetical protein